MSIGIARMRSSSFFILADTRGEQTLKTGAPAFLTRPLSRKAVSSYNMKSYLTMLHPAINFAFTHSGPPASAGANLPLRGKPNRNARVALATSTSKQPRREI
jgi:hypothetical protein